MQILTSLDTSKIKHLTHFLLFMASVLSHYSASSGQLFLPSPFETSLAPVSHTKLCGCSASSIIAGGCWYEVRNFYQKRGQACREGPSPRVQGSAWEGRAGGARQGALVHLQPLSWVLHCNRVCKVAHGWVGSGSVEPIPTGGMFPNTSSGPVVASPCLGSKVQSFGAES